MIIEQWINIQNMTIKLFAKKIGVSRSQVHKYMYERAIPRYEIMQKIFEFTNKAVTPNDFFGITMEISKPDLQGQKTQFKDYQDVKD